MIPWSSADFELYEGGIALLSPLSEPNHDRTLMKVFELSPRLGACLLQTHFWRFFRPNDPGHFSSNFVLPFRV